MTWKHITPTNDKVGDRNGFKYCVFAKEKDCKVLVTLFQISEDGKAIALKSKKAPKTPTEKDMEKFRKQVEDACPSTYKNAVEIAFGDYIGFVAEEDKLTLVNPEVFDKDDNE